MPVNWLNYTPSQCQKNGTLVGMRELTMKKKKKKTGLAPNKIDTLDNLKIIEHTFQFEFLKQVHLALVLQMINSYIIAQANY